MEDPTRENMDDLGTFLEQEIGGKLTTSPKQRGEKRSHILERVPSEVVLEEIGDAIQRFYDHHTFTTEPERPSERGSMYFQKDNIRSTVDITYFKEDQTLLVVVNYQGGNYEDAP